MPRTLLVFAALAALFFYGGWVMQGESLDYEPPSVAPGPLSRQTISVAEAYRRLPHRQMSYRAGDKKIDAAANGYLRQLFALTDKAVVARVLTQSRMGRSQAYDPTNYAAIMYQMNALSPPDDLRPAHNLILNALNQQHQYFILWQQAKDPKWYSSGHSLVRGSHGKLIQAYEKLMALYPQATKNNKEAFFDHLCALDFI
ncbi:MAG: hypothetical protein HOI33_08270 [Rhodospirillaceae bacterium]|jgi:hypothetical protein|nr:hypothetical protein [Rhodospirillaceae bacterium]MBT5752689.1 hypothetical protein [Rhodospirillaceae bacterium]